MVQKLRSVALLIETSNAYARGILAGITDYVRQHEGWSIYLPEQERGGTPPRWLSTWSGDGIVARIENDEIAMALKHTELPVVDVSAARHLKNIPWVETDDEAIAGLAVQHLSERGFKNFGFYGDSAFNWAIWRKQNFERLVAEAGGNFFPHDSISRLDKQYSWDREKVALAKWLSRLPRPIGIMACYEIQAQKLLDVCREQNIAVPEEVAVLGVDNDLLICDLASPRLSSVICNTKRTGFEAASLLDRMMSGEEVGSKSMLVEPLGVETRQSTDILAIDDADVAAALRFIRENAASGINVSDVLRAVPLSRRVLESRFRSALGRTPHEEITRLRIGKVKELLTGTDLSLSEIASRTGFRHDEYLSVAFKKAVGVPPRDFRRAEGSQGAR